MSAETETINIPKAAADYIRKQEHFKLYTSLNEFVMEAVRRHLEELMRAGIIK